MSRTDDYGLQGANREPHERSQRTFDHAAEIASRAGLTREAAKHEMEKFLGVAEYETRKLVGQHSTLRQPDAPVSNEPKLRNHSKERTEHRERDSRADASGTQASPENPPADVQLPTSGESATTQA